MTKINNLIPKENYKPFEVAEVRYLNHENKELTKQPDKITEKDFFIACHLHEGDKKTAENIGLGGALGLGALTVFCPPAGQVVTTASTTIAGVAKLTNIAAKNRNETLEEGAEIIDIFSSTTAMGGFLGKGLSGLKK